MKEDAAAYAVSGDLFLDQPRLFIPADTTRYYSPTSKLKRVFDLLVSLLALLVTAPMMLVLALLIKRSSPGPVFFIQERLGRDGRPFNFYKFRSMKHNSDDAIHRQFAAMFINGDNEGCSESNEGEEVFKLKADPRITTIGAWLRKTSLDELPQLFDVLLGNMSLVGPRPLPLYHYMELPESVRRLRERVRPGITGLWQVSGRSEASTEGMERWDTYYVRNWSVWLDIVILVRTVRVVLTGKGAY